MYDQYFLLLRGSGAAFRADLAAAKAVSNLLSTIEFEREEFGAVFLLRE